MTSVSPERLIPAFLMDSHNHGSQLCGGVLLQNAHNNYLANSVSTGPIDVCECVKGRNYVHSLLNIFF